MTLLDRAETEASVSEKSGGGSRIISAAAFLTASVTLSLVCQDFRAGWLALVVALNFTMFLLTWRIVFRDRLSYVDPGIVFVTVVAVYSIIPLLTTELMNFNFGATQDSRLSMIVLDDGIISTTIANANAIIAGFGAAYLALRRPVMPSIGRFPDSALAALWALFLLAAVVQLGIAVTGSDTEGYGDEYLLIQSLPVILIQMLNIMTNLFYVTLFGLIVHYVSIGRLQFVALLVAGSLAFFLFATGARTPLVLIVFASIVCWDHLRKRIGPLLIVLLFVIAITVFLILGALRGGGDSIAVAFAQSEFMAVFVTALDIRQIYLTGASSDAGFILLISDLLRLVPQQILPFEKIDPASWYVTTFYPHYAATGGGLAFGMLAEAALSGGFFEALLRGFGLGILLSVVINFITKRQSIWTYIIYIWLIASIYQSFRDTTFTLPGRFAFQFFPAIILCAGVSTLFRRDERNRTGQAYHTSSTSIG